MGDFKDNDNIQKKCLESKRVRYSPNFNLIIRHMVTKLFHPCHKYQEQPRHLAFTSSKSTMEPPEQCVEYV